MKYLILAAMLAVSFTASAGNSNGCQGNCPSDGGGDNTANGGNGYGGSGFGGDGGSASAAATGYGVGVGVGGSGGEGGRGGAGGDGGSAVALGGGGGHVANSGNSSNLNANTAKGGDATQGQLQGQSQTSVSGSKSVAQQALENSNRLDNGNTVSNGATGSGNVTNVGGDTTLVERNAPPVFLGAITPTTCGGSINAGGSSRDGAGAFGVSWVGKECSIRMIGDRYQQLGMIDTACEVYKSTKAFKEAAKRNPKLRDVSCTIKPAPAPLVIPAQFQEAHTPRG